MIIFRIILKRSCELKVLFEKWTISVGEAPIWKTSAFGNKSSSKYISPFQKQLEIYFVNIYTNIFTKAAWNIFLHFKNVSHWFWRGLDPEGLANTWRCLINSHLIFHIITYRPTVSGMNIDFGNKKYFSGQWKVFFIFAQKGFVRLGRRQGTRVRSGRKLALGSSHPHTQSVQVASPTNLLCLGIL